MNSRRGFLLGLTSLLAAPAIVRASSLMPVKVFGAGDLFVNGQVVGRLLHVSISVDNKLSLAIEYINKEIYETFGLDKSPIGRPLRFGTTPLYEPRPFLARAGMLRTRPMTETHPPRRNRAGI